MINDILGEADQKMDKSVDATREGVRRTMSDTWYLFGSADLVRYMRAARRDLLWRKYL